MKAIAVGAPLGQSERHSSSTQGVFRLYQGEAQLQEGCNYVHFTHGADCHQQHNSVLQQTACWSWWRHGIGRSANADHVNSMTCEWMPRLCISVGINPHVKCVWSVLGEAPAYTMMRT